MSFENIILLLPTISLLLLATASLGVQQNVTSSGVRAGGTSSEEKILSRKKRFLVFPEGSSLQLVFCLTDASVSIIGDIFLWGSTAALAWELPQDPYSPFDHHADPLHRRQDQPKSVYYTDNRGKLLFKVPYKRKPIVNPAFAKRSVDSTMLEVSVNRSEETQPEVGWNVDRKWMHERQETREYLNTEHLDEKSVEFHRHGRKGLYEKLEVFLRALGMNGRECVLRTLCAVGKSGADPQGTFVEELVRAVFTLPHGKVFDKPNHAEYDLAHRAEDSCESLYPDCSDGSPE